MAFELSITAPFRFSINARAGFLSMFWGRGEAGFALELDYGRNASGKLVETWREAGCLNVSAFGLHLMTNGAS